MGLLVESGAFLRRLAKGGGVVEICQTDAGWHESELSANVRQKRQPGGGHLQGARTARPCGPGRATEAGTSQKPLPLGIRHSVRCIDAQSKRVQIRSELARFEELGSDDQ